MVTSTNFTPLGVLLESWPGPGLVLAFMILPGAVAGAAGGGLAFARARERLRQRLVLGALAGALTSLVLLRYLHSSPAWAGRVGPAIIFGFWCIFGGYAAADGISILLKAIGRRPRT